MKGYLHVSGSTCSLLLIAMHARTYVRSMCHCGPLTTQVPAADPAGPQLESLGTLLSLKQYAPECVVSKSTTTTLDVRTRVTACSTRGVETVDSFSIVTFVFMHHFSLTWCLGAC